MTKPLTAKDVAEPEPHITMRVKEFSRREGISERQVYRLIKKRVLKSFKLGRMRMINIEEYRKMVSG